MTRTTPLLRPLSALLPLVLLAPIALAEVGTERLANRGFELDEDDNGMPDGWALAPHAPSSCVAGTTTDARTGAKALQVSASGGDTCQVWSDAIAVPRGAELDAEVYARHTAGSAGCYFRILAFTSQGALLDDMIVGYSACGEEWTRAWQLGSAPAGTTHVRIEIAVQPFPTTTAQFDDASLKVV